MLAQAPLSSSKRYARRVVSCYNTDIGVLGIETLREALSDVDERPDDALCIAWLLAA
jgi:hypothetical protein